MRYYIAILAFSLAASLSGQSAHIQNYIDQYREIAVAEMHRSGIPASIKLAQGILESDAGRSELALNSSNHFGIKCGPIWDGPTFYKEDDDRDKRGKLIKSCFRVFSDPAESYQAHSQFLRNPNKAYRYGWLFDLDRTDYKSWAWGLKESGYATNPRYAVLLISLIEKYQLYSFDYYEPPTRIMVSRERESRSVTTAEKISPRQITTSWKANGTDDIQVIRGKVTNNGLTLVYAEKDDTPEILAGRYDVEVSDLIEFNERISGPSQTLMTAERVYLEKKKKKYKGSTRAHTVLKGESIYEIAQIYGLRLDKLLKRNRLEPGEEPVPGSHIYLRKKVSQRNRPVVIKHLPIPEAEEKPVVSNHIVERGDTLFSIARKYDLTVDQIKSINDLQTSLIIPGQILTVSL